MASEDTQTTTTGIANPALNSTITKLATGIGDLYKPGSSSYIAPGSTTTGAWQSSLDAANNPAYSGGIAGAIESYGRRAAGGELGLDDPAYRQVRANLADDVTTATNNSFNNSGLFGSDSNRRGLAEGLTSSLGALDLQQLELGKSRQAEAATLLPQLLQGGQLPSSLAASVGASQDADAQNKANGQIDYLSRIMGLVNGASGAAGTTTSTTTKQDPGRLLLSALIAGASAL